MGERSGKREKIKKAVPWLLFFAYAAVLLRITVFREGFGTYELFSGRINTGLFTNYEHIVREGRWFSFVYLFFGNIAWFVPWGLFFRAYLAKPAWISVLSGTLLSLFIEVMQFVFGTGYSEIDDLILNTLGAAAGCILGSIYLLRTSGRKW